MSGRRLSVIATALTVLIPAGIGGSQDPPTGSPRFKSSVSVVSVSAIVRDRSGRLVRDLSQKDFVVAEGGQAKKILDFRAEADGPIKLGLLFDASGSMRVGRKAVDADQAARHLLAAFRGKDEGAIFSFDTRLDLVHGFTSNVATLEGSLGKVNQPFGQTSLYDAIAEAAETVAAHGRGSGQVAHRAALVVLTDGIDTRSRQTMEQVAAIASAIDVPVYVIAVMAAIDDPKEDATPAFDAGGLEMLARNTGGEMFSATAPAHASIAARRIIDELRHQYVLAFEASPTKGWRQLEVKARNPKWTVRARTGYSAGATSRPVSAMPGPVTQPGTRNLAAGAQRRSAGSAQH
jgi:VWFA-related protein